MTIVFNQGAFAETLKARRESMELGVREAAEQIKIPDLPDFLAICAWLNRDPAKFWQRNSTESSTREQVRSILAQDGRIDHEIIMAIDAIIKLATEGKHG